MDRTVPFIDERRESARRPTYMPASIVEPRRGTIASCTVRNISRTGAKLSFDDATDLPPIFWLRITGTSELRYCSDKWCRDQVMGIDFTAERAVQAIDEEAQNIRQRMRLITYPHIRGERLTAPIRVK